MESNKQDKAIRRGVILHQILTAHGYKYLKSEDNFDFYFKELIDKPSFTEVFGFNNQSENAIITFFGIESKYPISCDCELERLAAAIKGGYELQKLFNAITTAEEAKEASK